MGTGSRERPSPPARCSSRTRAAPVGAPRSSVRLSPLSLLRDDGKMRDYVFQQSQLAQDPRQSAFPAGDGMVVRPLACAIESHEMVRKLVARNRPVKPCIVEARLPQQTAVFWE